MQKGNLESFKKNNKNPKKNSWFSWLNPMRYMPHVLYNDFLNEFIGFKGKVDTYFYYHIYPKVIDFPLFSAIKIKNLPRDLAKTNKIDLSSMKKLSYSIDFTQRVVKIHSGLEFEYKVKWVLLNFKRILQIKALYPSIKRSPKVKGFKNFHLKERLSCRFIEPEKITLKNPIATQEELISIKPYIKTFKNSDLYSMPIEKEAMNKNHLSLTLLEKFKQKLSTTAKVRPSEVKVISAYENVHIELYKDLEHNSQRNTLMCYLDENKKHIQKPKNFYLVFGQRLADKKVFTIIHES